MGQTNHNKALTDLIFELLDFVQECKRTAEQPTVLEGIDLPELSLVASDLDSA